MKRYVLLFLFPLTANPLFAQTSGDVTACLRACLQVPELETAFTQEWGALRPLYLRKREAPGILNQPADEAMGQLTATDFQGLPWEVIPVTKEEILQLPSEEAEFGILDAGIGFRGEQANVSLFVNLPRYPRKWMAGSFLLRKEGEGWAILERSIEVFP